jgi:hypothetical protein
MKTTKEKQTYEGEVLSVLAFEFRSSDRSESERKIKRRIHDKNLGSYDQARIDALRGFKDDVLEELSKATRSRFWLCTHGKYADMQDWDFSGLLQYFEFRGHLT